jgi:hypothetical protein
MTNKLYPNCSEYVARIKLTPEELVKAKELAIKFKFNEEDLKNFYEHLENGTAEDENSFGSFIEEEYTKPYIFIKETILEERDKYNITKQKWWDKDKQ